MLPQNQIPIGIIFPIRLGNSGYFEQSFDTITQITTNLINFFSTKKGERPLNPEFGTDLFSNLMEEDTDSLKIIAQNIIQSELSLYFSTLQFVSATISNVSDSDRNVQRISITVQETLSTEFINIEVISNI